MKIVIDNHKNASYMFNNDVEVFDVNNARVFYVIRESLSSRKSSRSRFRTFAIVIASNQRIAMRIFAHYIDGHSNEYATKQTRDTIETMTYNTRKQFAFKYTIGV